MVYFETVVEPAAPIAREKQIKDYARAKKIAMINSVNSEWNDLAELWFAVVSRNDPPRYARDDTASEPHTPSRLCTW